MAVSPAAFSERHGDVVILALTSRDQGDESLRLADWRAEGLPKPTWVKPLIGTLSDGLVVGRLGTLAETDRACVRAALARLIDERFAGPRPDPQP